jgi:hypothetical protein
MSDILWTNVRVRLGDLKPWASNPRQSSKAQARRLLASFEKFGQVQTVAIDPDCNVLELDARQSNRALTDAERRELVVSLHAGAVGSWDWNAISGWNSEELQSWGMDGDLLRNWNLDALNLREMIESEGAQDPMEEWEGMPEYKHEDKTDEAAFTIRVFLRDTDDLAAFGRLIGKDLTGRKFVWFSKQPRGETYEVVD